MDDFLFNEILHARQNLHNVAVNTPTSYNANLSLEFNSKIYLKREDLQIVRSYKLRGAYNKIKSLTSSQTSKGVICASAGNHAQGVAYSCRTLNIMGKIYMPLKTPLQKVEQVKKFGSNNIEIVLAGDTYDDAYNLARQDASTGGKVFIHPFNDSKVIAGQGTVGLEILDAVKAPIDYVFVPIGGGGLASGIISVFSNLSPHTKIIGVEPAGAASMKTSIQKGENTTLSSIDSFVDGAAVKRVGNLTFKICREGLQDIIAVPEGKVCSTLLRLYNEEAMVVEPAGALTIAALDFYKKQIAGKVVVCIVSGGNSDILRIEEIKNRALQYEGLKHYIMVQFQESPRSIKDFIIKVLGPDDEITNLKCLQNIFTGPVVIGIQVKEKHDFNEIERRLKLNKFNYTCLIKKNDEVI
jgi:threonine dehydratase